MLITLEDRQFVVDFSAMAIKYSKYVSDLESTLLCEIVICTQTTSIKTWQSSEMVLLGELFRTFNKLGLIEVKHAKQFISLVERFAEVNPGMAKQLNLKNLSDRNDEEVQAVLPNRQ